MGWVIVIVVAMVLDYFEGRTCSSLCVKALSKSRGRR